MKGGISMPPQHDKGREMKLVLKTASLASNGYVGKCPY